MTAMSNTLSVRKRNQMINALPASVVVTAESRVSGLLTLIRTVRKDSNPIAQKFLRSLYAKLDEALLQLPEGELCNKIAARQIYWDQAKRSGLCVAVDEQLSQLMYELKLIQTAASAPVQVGAPTTNKTILRISENA
jgi:hypothetical protein